MNTNENGITFDDWMDQADNECLSISGCSIHDLPDGNSYDAWNDGATPLDYVTMLLEEEGFPFDYTAATDIYEPATIADERRAPLPIRANLTDKYGLAPYGETFHEEIVLENGRTIIIRRNHSANGKIQVIR